MESHLLQMRGLKLGGFVGITDIHHVASFTDAWIETSNKEINVDARGMSHLLQMRGLKHSSIFYDHKHQVASFTDAWIETGDGY